MKHFLLLTFVCFSNVLALTPKEIEKLSSQEPSRENLVPELKIFGDASERKVTVSIKFPKGGVDPKPFKAKEKVVGGKYFVSELLFSQGGEKVKVTAVVSYNDEESTYEMWSLDSRKNIVLRMKGIPVKGTNIISWISVSDEAWAGHSVIIVNQYHKDKITWREVNMKSGKVLYSLDGEATKIK